ncbi:Hypothetical protein D9617_17g047740 [Elsinoe fawcettii]|nr:Hypothetical protein D9617_17g047740 [Elsinoe fawcettii]
MRSLLVITGLLLLVVCSVSANPVFDSVIYKRADDKNKGQDQKTFDQETTQFENVGLCRSYKTNNWNGRSLATCNVYCKKPEAERDKQKGRGERRKIKRQDKPVGKLGAEGVTCMGDTTGNAPDLKGPDGDIFTMGKCECSAPAIAKVIAEEVLKALPMLDNILCQVATQALSVVADLGSVVFPGGIAVKGVATMVKAAKTIVQNGDTAVGMTSWFGDICNPDNDPKVAAVLAQGDKWFDPLAMASSKIAEGAGCVVSKDKCKDLPPENPPPADVTPANDNNPDHPQPKPEDEKPTDVKTNGTDTTQTPSPNLPTSQPPTTQSPASQSTNTCEAGSTNCQRGDTPGSAQDVDAPMQTMPVQQEQQQSPDYYNQPPQEQQTGYPVSQQEYAPSAVPTQDDPDNNHYSTSR